MSKFSKSSILSEVDAFLSRTGMGPSYFGKRAIGNSELVGRLRAGKRIWPETEERVRDFIKSHNGDKSSALASGEAA